MKNIQGVKIGNTINVSINGKLYKKSCQTTQEANEFFSAILKAKENPTDDNINIIRGYLNEKLRKLFDIKHKEIEIDIVTGKAYLAGFNTPIPDVLLNVIKEYFDNNFPITAIINFWKLLMINPDERVRTSLFDFISKHDFVLTDKGYMIVYKAVYPAKMSKSNIENAKACAEANIEVKPVDSAYQEFLTNKYLQVKKWKTSPNRYVAYKKDGVYAITKIETANSFNTSECEILGKLGDLYSAYMNTAKTVANVEPVVEIQPVVDNVVHYTDMHSKSMDIILGAPTKMNRRECNSDPAVDCSYGLHVGATKYVENYGDSNSIVLACFVNPAHVVAVPTYDKSKMRVTEYFPFAVATYKDRKIDIIEQKYFEDDYCQYEMNELNQLVDKIKASEVPIVAAINAKEESRPMSELLKIVESRLIELK